MVTHGGLDLYSDWRVLRLDTKAEATQNRYNGTVEECERKPTRRWANPLYTRDSLHYWQLTDHLSWLLLWIKRFTATIVMLTSTSTQKKKSSPLKTISTVSSLWPHIYKSHEAWKKKKTKQTSTWTQVDDSQVKLQIFMSSTDIWL